MVFLYILIIGSFGGGCWINYGRFLGHVRVAFGRVWGKFGEHGWRIVGQVWRTCLGHFSRELGCLGEGFRKVFRGKQTILNLYKTNETFE